ncbi:MAG: SGNH/GDSL hydrolase family protein, partial [Burkholderiales bacterium]|nr:SGNH/GDSL hydrolase family protein [Opitutaceae bacterium]
MKAASRYPMAQARLFSPFWESRVVYGESVALEKSGPEKPADGTLLFTPAKVLRVRSSDGATEYREGVDFTVDAAGRRLVLMPGSAIPFIDHAALYKRKGDPQSIGRKIDDPETYLFYAERWFPRVQVEVDYERAEDWAGYAPAFAGADLSRTVAKLKRGEGLRLCVTGDSISTGANASKTVPPYMPPYVTLLQKGLEQAYGGEIAVANLAVPGATAKGGVDKIHLVVAEKPDLVVIAFGMNDTAGHHADHYQAQLKAVIAGVRAALPD